ncbi:MAG: MBL fold metallo-hydrolase [Verrucomicrobia bacterium]|nr:MBL fold metallo-hydrolase [Verrucomicrobiota bacterium]
MKLTTYTGGLCATNGYLVETPDGNLVVDAPEGIAAWVAARGVRVDHVLLTHQHFDHVLDAAALQAAGARLHALEACSDEVTLESLSRKWGMPTPVAPYRIDQRLVPDADHPMLLCGLKFSLYHIPGHAMDSVVFHLPDLACAFSGDTLFAGSIGRTDLPGGNHRQLLDAIARHLLTLPPQTRLLPGHGPATTIAAELADNPYLRNGGGGWEP